MSNFFDLLAGRAFRPDVMDTTVALRRRMDRARFMVVSGLLGRVTGFPMMLKMAVVDGFFIGEPEFAEVSSFESQVSAIKGFAARHECRHAAVLLSDAVAAFVTDKVSPRLTDEILLRGLLSAPDKVLGRVAEPDRDFSLVRHPKFSTCLVFSIARRTRLDAIKVLAGAGGAGLQVVRTQCLPTAVCAYLVDRHPALVARALSGGDLVLVDDSFVMYLPVVDGDWQVPSVKSGILNKVDVLDRLEKTLTQAVQARPGVSAKVVNISRMSSADIQGVLNSSKARAELFELPASETRNGMPILEFSALCHN